MRRAGTIFSAKAWFVFWMLGIASSAFSQDENILNAAKDLSISLDRSKERKIEQVSDKMQDAGKLIDQTVNLGDEKEIRNNIEQVRKDFESARQSMISVYEGILSDFYEKFSKTVISKFDRARYYDQKVDGYMNAASLAIFRADSVKDAHQSALYFANAYDNFINAYLNQLRSIRIYQDFPIEYPYDWDDFFKQRQIMLAREAAKDEEQEQKIQEEAAKSFSMIYYRVQIAAHSNPIPESQLASIYKGNFQVQMNFEDGWYKYTIGNFERYDKALELLKICNVKRAFIVAYDQNNVKQDIKKLIDNK